MPFLGVKVILFAKFDKAPLRLHSYSVAVPTNAFFEFFFKFKAYFLIGVFERKLKFNVYEAYKIFVPNPEIIKELT